MSESLSVTRRLCTVALVALAGCSSQEPDEALSVANAMIAKQGAQIAQLEADTIVQSETLNRQLDQLDACHAH